MNSKPSNPYVSSKPDGKTRTGLLRAGQRHSKSMHESTLRRMARRAGLLARKHESGWSLIDASQASRPSIAGPGLSSEDVATFCRSWQRGGDALQAV
jgi:hypothetical protein